MTENHQRPYSSTPGSNPPEPEERNARENQEGRRIPDQDDWGQNDWVELDDLLGTHTQDGQANWSWDSQTIEVESVEKSPPDEAVQDTGAKSTAGDPQSEDGSGERPDTEFDTKIQDENLHDEHLTDKYLIDEDIQDPALILAIEERHAQVTPGESVEMRVSLLNNGSTAAPFTLKLEGLVHDGWFSVEPKHMQLRPGQKGHFVITVAPPRLSSSRAGTFPLYISARSASYGQRRSRLATRLTILPFVAFSLGELHPATLTASWQAPECTTLLPIRNDSNTDARIYLQGSDGPQRSVSNPGQEATKSCRIEFLLPGARTAHTGHAIIAMAPGQTLHAAVRIRPRHRRPVGLRRHVTPFRITGWLATPDGAGGSTAAGAAVVTAATGEAHPVAFAPQGATRPAAAQWSMARTASGKLSVRPLVGPRAMTAAAGCGLVTLLAAGAVTAVLFLTLLLPGLRTPQAVTPSVPSIPAAVEIVVKIAEPVPTVSSAQEESGRPAAAPLPDAVASAPGAVVAPQPAVDNGTGNSGTGNSGPVNGSGSGNSQITTIGPEGVPLVQPGMVTSPGEAVTARAGAIQAVPASEQAEQAIIQVDPASVSAPGVTSGVTPVSDPTTMTYEQMFRTVGDEFGLDWRLLAAQAYVESGFNPVALGSQGDLGLMQVLPATWQEWAPQVDATDPFDSYSNVRVAAAYLDYLRTLLDQRNGHAGIEWMLVAYNWGPNQLQAFINAGSSWDDLDDGRRNYANDILGIAESLPSP